MFATAAAYTGLMVAWGCAVWGTGYYYPPYVWYGGRIPIYHPFYPTYGYSAWYNPWTGTYGRGAAVYGPYGGAGVGARYNPYTGTYARGAAAYGPYGGVGVAQGYNARTGTYARGGVASGPYGARGAAEAYNPRTGHLRRDASGRRRLRQLGSDRRAAWRPVGDDVARHQQRHGRDDARDARGAAAARPSRATRPVLAGGSFAGQSGSGDIYAGHDGNVYKKNGDSWQKYDNGGWNDVQQPTAEQRQAAQNKASQAGSQARDRASASGWDSATAGPAQS